jgi:hypothetical protein
MIIYSALIPIESPISLCYTTLRGCTRASKRGVKDKDYEVADMSQMDSSSERLESSWSLSRCETRLLIDVALMLEK